MSSQGIKKAFTLAEVLITLVVLGIVAAISVPTIMNGYKWKQYRTAAIKAQSVLNQLTRRYYAENGYAVECRYWKNSPVKGAKCTSRKENGDCAKYTLPDGSNLPGNYNGYFSECNYFYTFMIEHMNIAKKCDSNGFLNGCMPEYEGYDTIWRANNVANNPTDYDVNVKTSGCSGFRKANILAKRAFVTTDGMIFFPYSNGNTAIIAVDVNGQKGPNKWGHDLHTFVARSDDFNESPTYYPQFSCIIAQPGGITTQKLILKK